MSVLATTIDLASPPQTYAAVADAFRVLVEELYKAGEVGMGTWAEVTIRAHVCVRACGCASSGPDTMMLIEPVSGGPQAPCVCE